jgi:hypothetical protein
MIYVVVEEVIPETQRDKFTDLAVLGLYRWIYRNDGVRCSLLVNIWCNHSLESGIRNPEFRKFETLKST